MYIGLHVQCCQLHLSYLIKLAFSGHIFEKYSNSKFNEIPFRGNRVVPCNWVDRRTDMTKLIVAFHNLRKQFAKAPKTTEWQTRSCCLWHAPRKNCVQKLVAKYSSIKHKFSYFSVIAAATLNSTQNYMLFVVNISLTNKQLWQVTLQHFR